MNIQQKLQLTLKHALTPSLQLAIRLLPLSRLELLTTINQELTLNPVLEESAELELIREETQEIKIKEEKEKLDPEQIIKDSEIEDFFFEYFDNVYVPYAKEKQESVPIEATISQPVNLASHLRWQLALAKLTDRQKEISEIIIGNLILNGLLAVSIEEIMQQGDYSQQEVEEVLSIIQRLDPVGVAARDIKECLLLQLEQLGLKNSPAAEIIDKYLNLVKKFDYKALSTKLGISIEQVKYYIDIIKNLDPSPGYRYNTAEPIYIKPDVEVVKVGDNYEVELLDEGLPKIRINPLYKKIIKEKDKFPPETISYVKEKLKAGLWLIKSLELRQQTLYRVAKAIVEFQRDFLDYGPSRIKPLTLKDIAAKIQMHESTISRAVTNKYMMTPQGLFEMKYFFHSGIESEYGEDISSLVVKDKIKEVIEQEPSSKPYSDSKIAQLLKKQGIKISRRTIAKYREELNIPASHIRKNIKKY
jgi:RNA polymerase sigma-54 factor